MLSVGSISSTSVACYVTNENSVMGRLRMIYAMLLAVIYMTATAMSSLSILTCEHDHMHHGGHVTACAEHKACCHCGAAAEAEASFGCGHQHTLLGDNLTEYAASGERSSLRTDYPILQLTDYATLSTLDVDLSAAAITITACRQGYESAPPRAAIVEHESLRAPPCWA